MSKARTIEMETTMPVTNESPSVLPEGSREQVAGELNRRLLDGLDLHSQIKVAHWNIKGAHFASLHPLFEAFASDLAETNDEIAERAVTLGAIVTGTVRDAASSSTLPDYPPETTRDLEHVRLLAERFDVYLEGLRQARRVAEREDDTDTVDLLTARITQFEKHGWFLRATLAS